MGAAYEAQGKIDRALSTYAEALHLDPSMALGHYRLGSLLAKQGRRAAAIAEYREAVRLKPDFAEAIQALALIGG